MNELKPIELMELPVKPTVSIAIICFNYGHFLGECLDSCLAQTVAADEIVVVNDGSTDNTTEILHDYSVRHPQIRVIHQTNGGMCSATNTAVSACSGDVVLLLDADDAMLPQRVEKVLAAFRTRQAGLLPGLVHHYLLRFSALQSNLGLAPYYAGGTAPEGWLAPQALEVAASPVVTETSGLAFRKEVWTKIAPLDSDRSMVQDLQIRTAATLLAPIAWIPEPLTRFRMHGASDNAGTMMSLDNIRLIRKRAGRLDRWLRQRLEQFKPGAASLWRPLDDHGGYLWQTFLEHWLSGGRKDVKLLWKVLRHPDTRAAPRQYRLYYYGAAVMSRTMFISYSRLIFGNNPAKAALRRLLGRS